MDANDAPARQELLAYAAKKFPDADAIRLLQDDFNREIVGIVQLKLHGARVSAGFSRELWEHKKTFDDLRTHTEHHQWGETVNHAAGQRALLGENGWLDWK